MRTVGLFAVLAIGCGTASEAPAGNQSGTIASLTPALGGNPVYLALGWDYDNGHGDQLEVVSKQRLADPKTPHQAFSVALASPTHYLLDFDVARTEPACDTVAPGTACRDTPVQGHGKLAIGTVFVFEDVDGDGKATISQAGDRLLGYSELLLLDAQGLDAQALTELGQLTLLNPQALKPGFNVARIRCKAEVHWPGSFDPIEIVSPEEPLIIESPAAIDAQLKSGALCNNWS